ncbi:hypothetical protein GCM10010302_06590 [Streptomyces polychromogenes]|uniref:Insertion element IS402-like domain-containing protein n=1 Tax=Streptomyces polychromogenes TaxID=67342 RepID=A0ABP3ENW9_9ACTN
MAAVVAGSFGAASRLCRLPARREAREPLLPKSDNRCGRWRDHRQVINGIIYRVSSGCQWRELPARFGPWQTIHKRHTFWSADGTGETLFRHVLAVADSEATSTGTSTSTPPRSAPPCTLPERQRRRRPP